MKRQFTENQEQAISLRGKNILVSAAAGSGKTAVLVERIIRMISEGEDPADIDRLLIVTFTNAAAGEMRERISAAIAEKLVSEPENAHLQRQATLIHNAQITTIHSFCLFVIRNHFQEIGLDPAFRVADEGETGLLQQEVLEQVLEEAFHEYECGEAPAFGKLVESYSTGKREKVLEESILSLHRFAMSYPWPYVWLKEHGEDYEFDSLEKMRNSGFITFVMEYLRHILPELVRQLKQCIRICERPAGPYMYGENLEKSLVLLEKAARAGDFSEMQAAMAGVAFDRLSSKKDDAVDPGKREAVKQMRNGVKKQVEQINEQFFSQGEEGLFAQCRQVSPVVRELTAVTARFGERFEAKKREKNLIDFSDMEHLALEILCRRAESDDGVFAEPTAAALELREYFKEIMVDEYQDSNLVQECILGCISGERAGRFDRFMVGDVKQSIYKFRLARPELFMEKFHTYSTEEGEFRRVDLYQNFRSRREVIGSVNLIFKQLLAKDLGGIDYDDRAKLHFGAAYYDEIADEEKPEDEETGEKERIRLSEDGQREEYKTEFLVIEKAEGEEATALEREAEVIALRIRKLMRELKVMGEDGQGLRPLRYGDIVILFRSSGAEETFEEIFGRYGIPCFVNSRTGYFQAKEVQVILQLLRVIDNPLQDIPLFGVLRSCFASFTDVEAAEITAAFPGRRKLYKKIESYAEGADRLAEKCRGFLNWFKELRRSAVWLSVRELLAKIMEESHYLEYVTAMPDGAGRRANAQMLLQKAAAFEKTSFKGLYHFIRYIDQIEKYNIDQGEAGTQDELADVVRLMTIHKSKGLEFPVCFVAGTGRRMNRRDASAPVLTDMDMGIGVDQVDETLRTKRRTLPKIALSRKIRLDSQAEELRVLYVALTRAKEKLIITGVTDSAEKLLRGKSGILEQESIMLPYLERSDAGSFLELLAACAMRTESMAALLSEYGIEAKPFSEEAAVREDIVCRIVRDTDIQANLTAESYRKIGHAESLKKDLITCVINDDMKEYLEERFGWLYPHENLQRLYAKTTVSELKMAAIHSMAGKEEDGMQEEDAGKRLFEEETPAPYLPLFLRKEEERQISGALRGSAVHRVMELMEFGEPELCYDAGRLGKDLERFGGAGLLQEEYRKAVSRAKIVRFMNSPLAKRMHLAAKEGKLWREQPFMLGISADRLSSEFPETEQVLVQGIIDAFFEEDGEIVLLDYKTDVIKSPEELAERYRVQLDYYGEALQRLTGKKVKERILYSFYLEEEVRVI